MAKTKKQHYVAQSILRSFGIGREGKESIWVLDKRNGNIFQSPVRDVGHENYFYEYHGEGGDIELENLTQKLDDKGAGIINRIIEDSKLPESKEDMIWLSYYVAAQMIRTPMTRNDMENLRQLIIHHWGKDIYVGSDEQKTIGEYGPEDAKAASLRSLVKDVPVFAKLLQEKVWNLKEALNPDRFIISDNPVTRHNMIDRGPRGNLGLKNIGIELYMPLSPRLVIHIMCPRLASVVLLTPELAPAYSLALTTRKPIPLKSENVEFINSQQVIWSERFVFSKERQNLDMPSVSIYMRHLPYGKLE
jgi:hypothetical protein